MSFARSRSVGAVSRILGESQGAVSHSPVVSHGASQQSITRAFHTSSSTRAAPNMGSYYSSSSTATTHNSSNCSSFNFQGAANRNTQGNRNPQGNLNFRARQGAAQGAGQGVAQSHSILKDPSGGRQLICYELRNPRASPVKLVATVRFRGLVRSS
jgi:hypothetical protein